MGISQISITERGSVPWRDWSPARKEAWQETGRHWHRTMREAHFANSASRRYGYHPRQGESGRSNETRSFRSSYTGRKLAKYGHTRPLELTGQSRALTRIRVIRATPNSVKVDLRAARGLNRKYRGSPIEMWDELTRIAEQEKAELVNVQAQGIQRALDANRKQTNTVVRG